MVEQNAKSWIKSVCAQQAPNFEKVYAILEEKGVIITPKEYITACSESGLQPDIDVVYIKLMESTATIDDVNMLLEDVVDSVRDRIQRKVRKNPTSGHITHGGHQRLGNVSMSSRTSPKRKRDDSTQSHGRSEHGHDKSTRKQRRNAKTTITNGGDA